MPTAAATSRSPVQLIEVITVGLPFCAFKLLTGHVLVQRPWVGSLGWALIALGCVDALINAGNLASLVVGRERVMGVCLTAIIARRWKPGSVGWDDLGISADVILSFVLVAVVIGFDLLASLPRAGIRVWSIAVVLNVLGAGIGRLSSSVGSLRSPRLGVRAD